MYRRNNDRRRLPCLKGTAPIFLVVMFLVSVHMSITNMRHAFQTVPDALDPYRNHLDNFASVFGAPMTPDLNNEIRAKEGGEGISVIKETREKINEDKLNTTEKEDEISDPSHVNSTVGKHDANTTVALEVPDETFSSLNVTLPPLLYTMPNDNNTAITLVAMGGLVDTYMAERCIRSIRRRGLFFGPIMLFTDNDGYKQYQETIPFMDNRTIIINSRDEDLYPREEPKEDQGKNQTPPLKKYAQRSMVFKRFKTHHSKYIEADPNLKDSIRFVMYVDVDNIIGSPMEIFFQEYTKMVAEKYPLAVDFHHNFTLTGGNDTEQLTPKTDKNAQNDFGFMSMFRDRHLKGRMHGYVRQRFFFPLLFALLVLLKILPPI